MSSKHLYHSADGLVLNALRGAIALNPALRLHSSSKSVYTYGQVKAQDDNRKTIAVISGGGAGHEPAHAGYTGRGMLSASVSGDIFASPSAKQILQTIYLASTSGVAASETEDAMMKIAFKDVVVIINNYTGDRLNFGLAIEKALASSHMKLESVIVADDVSLLQPGYDAEPQARKSLVGARGLAGNILVCKMLGAFAQRGADIARVKLLGDTIVHNLASVGVGLGHCHVPGRETNLGGSMQMADEECEIGLGLHNEPGAVRKRMDGPVQLVADMLRLIMRSKDGTGTKFIQIPAGNETFGSTDKVVLFVNNLGGMSQLEIGAVLDEVLRQLSKSPPGRQSLQIYLQPLLFPASLGIHPSRVYCSAYMTSLNAPGYSISVLNISSIERTLSASSIWNQSVNLFDLLDDPTDAVAWVGARHWPVKRLGREVKEQDALSITQSPQQPTRGTTRTQFAPSFIERGIRSACESVLFQQEALSEFDTILGDGDCGNTFGAGAKAVLNILEQENVDLTTMSPSQLVKFLGDILEDEMGGTIGALFAIFLTAVSASLKGLPSTITIKHWSVALLAGLDALGKYTPAKPGDRTLVDALAPFCEALSQDDGSLEQSADAARKGAESTRRMTPVLGRAAYVTLPTDAANLPPDPGAWGVLAIVEGFVKGLSSTD
ncbi:hypothetical protein H0H87_001979 [Tephrocybe sp. NHM501043]|nr:hypothetical protein H0H87_001979 [Tephrocybe sp. NHM501043]